MSSANDQFIAKKRVETLVRSHIYRLDRGHHPADAQHFAGVVRHQLQPDGLGYHSVHHPGTPGHFAADAQTGAPDADDELPSTQDAGDQRPLRQRPGQGVAGNHAIVPGGWRQPHRLSGSAGGPDAHPHWPFSSTDSDAIQCPGRSGGAIGEALLLDTPLSDLLRRTAGPQFSGDGPFAEPRGCLAHHRPSAGVRLHLGPAKDDHDPIHGSTAAGPAEHDAVDDAADDRILLHKLPHGALTILDRLQRNRRGNSILCNRMGSTFPFVPKGAALTGSRGND